MKIPSPWPWPSYYCQQPRTLSFRDIETNNKNMFFNDSSHCDNIKNDNVVVGDTNTTSTSSSTTCFTDSLETQSFSTSSTNNEQQADSNIEVLIKGLSRSETERRLFFEPSKSETSSIMEESKAVIRSQENQEGEEEGEEEEEEEEEEGFLLFIEKKKKTIMALSVESKDPYLDFKKSMEEMVEAHQELKRDWDGLEELLFCYLKVNDKSNHRYIVSAFVDLLLRPASDNPTTTTTSNESCFSCSCKNLHSPSSPLSFYTSCDDSSSSSIPFEEEEEIGISSPCFLSSLEAKNEIC